MSGILDLLSGPTGKQIISGISQQAGTSESKTSEVLQMALPLLTGAMQRNAATPQGASGLLGALNKHDGGILDNLGSLFQGGVDEVVTNDGGNILGHLLGSKQANIQNALSQKTGVNSSQIATILKVAAPIVLGYLGKQSRQNNVSSTDGLGSLLGGLVGGSSQTNSLLTNLLDSDGDGSIIDDVAGMALGNKKKGGLGGMLGGLFGK